MSLTARAFQIPKEGSRPEECEDALYGSIDRRLFAIADGATDSAFQKLWADLLVRAFIRQPPPTFHSSTSFGTWFRRWLKTQQTSWNMRIDWKSIPWHGAYKAHEIGGVATFLGIHFSADEPIWRGIAIGDCNSFHFLRGRDTCLSQPILSSREFGLRPAALSSIDPDYDTALSDVQRIGGRYYSGDVILLATDALARWILSQLEDDKQPLERILSLQGPDDFGLMINDLRQKKEIRNDDTSLLIIQVN